MGKEKQKINYYITKKRVEKNLRKDNLFYYELRHYDKNVYKYVIEKNVLVNFYGTMVTDKEILNEREYIDYKDFFSEYETVRNRNLNPYRKKV